MNVALIGATGQVGSRIATELVKRGHQVTGIVRNLDGVTPQPGVTLVRGDANEPSTLAPLFAGHDAVISASRFQGADQNACSRRFRRRASSACLWWAVLQASKSPRASACSIRPAFRMPIDRKRLPARPSSMNCVGSRQSTGPSCRRPHCWNRACVQANSGSAATSCFPMRTARVGSRWKTTP
jgi:NAD(P)H-binding